MNAQEIINTVKTETGIKLTGYVDVKSGRHPGELIKSLVLCGPQDRFKISIVMYGDRQPESFIPSEEFWAGTAALSVKKEFVSIDSIVEAVKDFFISAQPVAV